MQRIGVRACANIVAYSECVWTIAPHVKARYSSRCVGVSEDGRSLLSTAVAGLERDQHDLVRRQIVRSGTPLGLIANTPAVAIGDREVAERADDPGRLSFAVIDYIGRPDPTLWRGRSS